MHSKDKILLDRRRVLYAALMGGSGAALAACAPGNDSSDTDLSENDIWSGFDERITERTLAEAEKLFGLQFSEAERQQILGGAVEESADGFFAEQIKSLHKRRSQDIPNSLAPAMKFDPRLPGVTYPEQANSVALFAEEISAGQQAVVTSSYDNCIVLFHFYPPYCFFYDILEFQPPFATISLTPSDIRLKSPDIPPGLVANAQILGKCNGGKIAL